MTMLDRMRRHKNWLKWSLALVVLAFVALYFPTFMDQTSSIGASSTDVEQSLRRSLMIDKLRSALTDWMALSNAELEREYKQRNEKVKLQVVALTADKFRDKVTVSDTDVASYYDAHKAEYRKGEQRKVKNLLLAADAMRAKIIVTPQDIETYYNSNVQQYQTPEQVRASHILLKTEGK